MKGGRKEPGVDNLNLKVSSKEEKTKISPPKMEKKSLPASANRSNFSTPTQDVVNTLISFVIAAAPYNYQLIIILSHLFNSSVGLRCKRTLGQFRILRPCKHITCKSTVQYSRLKETKTTVRPIESSTVILFSIALPPLDLWRPSLIDLPNTVGEEWEQHWSRILGRRAARVTDL